MIESIAENQLKWVQYRNNLPYNLLHEVKQQVRWLLYQFIHWITLSLVLIVKKLVSAEENQVSWTENDVSALGKMYTYGFTDRHGVYA